MADTNLFDLAARVSIDNSGVDAALASTQKGALSLAEQFKATEAAAVSSNKKIETSELSLVAQMKAVESLQRERSAAMIANWARQEQAAKNVAKAVEGDMKSALQNISPGLAGIAGAAGPITLVAIGIGAAGVAAVATGIGIYELSKKTADYGEEIYKAQQKTGLSAETLSTLQVISRETGTSFEGLTTSAARLQVAISKGIDSPASEAGKALHLLTLDTEAFKTSLPDQQLVMTAKAIEGVTNQSDKNRAAQALLSRGWLQSADALKDIAEKYDEARAKADAFGLSMSQQDVEAAHRFEVAIKDLAMGVEGFGVQAGERTMPMVINALHNLGYALGVNESNWGSWGAFVGEILAHVVASAEMAASLVSNSVAMMVRSPYAAAKGIMGGVGTGLATGNWGMGYGVGSSIASQPFDQAQRNVQGTYNSTQKTLEAIMMKGMGSGGSGVGRGSAPSYPGGGGGKGGGGGDPAVNAKRLADLRLKAVVDELKFEEEANKRSLDRQWIDFDQYSGRYNATETKRHAAVVAGLQEEMTAAENIKKPQQQAIAIQEVKNKQAQEEITHTKNGNKVLDERAKLLDQLNDFIAQQNREINDARSGTDQYDKAIETLQVALKKAGVTEIDYKIDLAKTNAETLRAIELTRQLTRERYAIAQRPRFADPANLPQSVGIEIDTTDATRRRRALALSDEVTAKLHQLAGDITSTLDTAIRTGFEQGAKEGFRALALGFLQTIEKMAEDLLASSLFELLTKIVGGGGGGGGIGSTIVHSLAVGMPFVPFDNYPAMLHRGEAVIPASQNHGGGGAGRVVHNHYHQWNITTQDARSFQSQDTERQITQRANRIMQHSLLTG